MVFAAFMPFLAVSDVQALPATGAVLGVDVGYSEKKRSSAICRLEWSVTTITWTIDRFRALDVELHEVVRRVAGGREVLAAAFDGPLAPGLSAITDYRQAERLLTVGFQPFIGKPGASSAPVGQRLHKQATVCARAVLEHATIAPAAHTPAIHERAIVEAFPSSFLGLMIEAPKTLATRRGNRSDVYYQHLAETGGLEVLATRCLPERSLQAPFQAVSNHDDRAALVCALTALCVARGEFTAVGDEDGWIILPPRALIQDWADQLL